MRYEIKHKNGSTFAEVEKLTYSGEWMGDEFLTTSIKSEEPIEWALGDYIMYRGEKFTLNVIPTIAKQARRSSTREAFVYDSVKFYSLTDELTRCKFLDVVLEDNGAFYTGLPDFSFHCNSVEDLADRIKANLDRVYKGDDKWTVRVYLSDGVYYVAGTSESSHSSVGGEKNKVVSVNNLNAWEALALCDSEFDLNFVVRGRTITIGDTGSLLSRYFEYGKGKGLFKIERTTDDSQMVVTRLRAFGNSTNLPIRYYQKLEGSNVPNNMNVTRLMLPSFPEDLDPYIDSANIGELGVREATVYFDGSDGNEDIYPSIQWLKDASGNPLNVVREGSNIEDDGVFDEKTDLEDFTIRIPNLGFDIKEYLSQDEATISMLDGLCGGREFTIVDSELKDGLYELTLRRTEDSSLEMYFPNKNFQINAKDKFVLLNLQMPKEIVDAASRELERAATEWLSKNDYVVYRYSLSVDELFMQRQHDAHEENQEPSLHDTIKAGDVLRFVDSDLDIEASITIDHLEIKEGENRLPQYSITLTEEKAVGTIQRLQQKIDSIASHGGSGGGGGYDASEIDAMIRNVGGRMFLSKLNDDVANGKITFNKGFESKADSKVNGNLEVEGREIVGNGIATKNFVTGLEGTGAQIDKDGNAEMQSLSIREFLEVPELRFNRASVIAGTTIQSPCGGVIKDVRPIDAYSGEATLELGDDELFGSIAVGDLCWGYFHDYVNNANNATADSDDRKGSIDYKGFATVYFQIAEVLDSKSTTFRYELKEGTTLHPYVGMNFGGRGNTIDKTRQGFTIQTPNYTATYQLVGSWDWSDMAKYIVNVTGKLDGFESLAGVKAWDVYPYYGTIGTNYYFRGNWHSVDNDRRFIYITQSSNGMLLEGETETVEFVIRDTRFVDVTKDFVIKVNGNTVSADSEGRYIVTYSFASLPQDSNKYNVVATSKELDEHNQPLFVINSSFAERKLIYEYHLEVYKTAINPNSEVEGMFEFNDGKAMEFNNAEAVATIAAGDTIFARRMIGTAVSEYGSLVYVIDDGDEKSVGNDQSVSVEANATAITFIWYTDNSHTKVVSKRIIPVVSAKSSWMIYHDGNTMPEVPSAGEDISIKGWYRTQSTTSVWMSAKTSVSLLEGNWGEPVKIVGSDGTSVSIKGRVANQAALPKDAEDRDAYVTEDTGHLWVYYSGTKTWTDVGKFQGEVGKNAYMHIKYSHDGKTFSEATTPSDPTTIGETPAEWLGTYADNTIADSTDFNRYTWKKIVGDAYLLQINKAAAAVSNGTEFEFEFNSGDPMQFNDNSTLDYIGIGDKISARRMLNGDETTEGYLYYAFDNGTKISCNNNEAITITEASSITFYWYRDASFKDLIASQLIPVVKSGVSSFTSFVFKRQNTKPQTPTMGSYLEPIPEGWSDGIPSGEAMVWMSKRVFFDDATPSYWSEPMQMTDTADFDVEYTSNDPYKEIPNTVHGTSTDKSAYGWSNNADENTIWMATSRKNNGVWSNWTYSKVKGEKGEDSFVSFVFKRSQSEPSKPSGGSYTSPVPSGWNDAIPSGNYQVWMSKRTFFSDDRVTNDWTTPQAMTDTADFDVCYHAATEDGKAPKAPTSHHTAEQGNGWHDKAQEGDEWMATDRCSNDVWLGWQINKIKGEDGKDGADGYTPEIGGNGNWFIDGVDTGLPSKGDDGFSPQRGENGNWWEYDAEQGKYVDTGIKMKGEDGKDGKDGKDARSPYVGSNGNWFVWDDAQQKYIDSTLTSKGDDGHTPYIDKNTVTWWEWNAAQGKYTNSGIVAIGQNGLNGANGVDGKDGKDGSSINWRGSFASHPSNPQNNWAYYNTTDKKSYIYTSSAWYQMTLDGVDGKNGLNGKDGKDGKDGLSVSWQGERATPPSNPQLNWVYKDTDNGIVYIYNGTSWNIMTRDGDDGADGTNGTNGLSVYITYNDSTTEPATPTGNGTTGGWHTSITQKEIWMSQKVAASATSGTWGKPIKIKGSDGKDGTDGKDGVDGKDAMFYEIRVYDTAANTSTGFANDLQFNDGSKLAFNDGVVIASIEVGATISATRYLNNEKSTIGSLKYSIDNGTPKSMNNGDPIKIEEGMLFVVFTWLDANGNEITHTIIPVISNGATNFTSFVFKRSATKPARPTKGTFIEPVPTTEGWSDGIGEGEGLVWMSKKVFWSDNRETDVWSDPQQMSDTNDFDVEYSSAATYTPIPNSVHGTKTDKSQWGWSNEASDKTIWMATSTMSNEVWSDWTYTKVKGEKGDEGLSAYEVWAKTHTGTETDYLESLKGNSVAKVTEFYGLSNDESVRPTVWRNEVQQTSSTNKYLWNYEATFDNKGNKIAETTPVIISRWTKDGRGIVSVTEYYALSTSKDTEPTSWSTDVPTLTAENKYLWNYELVKYTEGADESTTPCIIGVYGDEGKSAYEVAKDNGYTGSESEWLKSLVGAQGLSAYEVYKKNGGTLSESAWLESLDGEDGLSAYDIYKAQGGTLSEDEWLRSLRGSDGASVEVQYSVDGSTNWHSTFTSGDMYMRQKVGGNWSNKIKIVGEDGDNGAYTDYQFAVNSSLTTHPTSGWQDAPPTVGTGQYLWMRERRVNKDGVVGNWSYARIGGEKGETGLSAYQIWAKTHTGTEADFLESLIGASGRSVNTIKEYYARNNSSTTAPTSGWSETMTLPDATHLYLWNKETVLDDKNEEIVTTTPTIISRYTTDGVGIDTIEEEYGLSTSKDTKPSSWSSSVPKMTATNKYLWNRETVVYTDGSRQTTDEVIIGVYGDRGDNGNDALSISLSNTTDSVSMDEEGYVVATTDLTTTVSVYSGTSKQALTNISVSYPSISGLSVTKNISTGVVTCSLLRYAQLPNDKAIVTITATCSKGTLTAEFTIQGNRQGSQGKTPRVIYRVTDQKPTISNMYSPYIPSGWDTEKPELMNQHISKIAQKTIYTTTCKTDWVMDASGYWTSQNHQNTSASRLRFNFIVDKDCSVKVEWLKGNTSSLALAVFYNLDTSTIKRSASATSGVETYENVPKGRHFFDVAYSKSAASISSGDYVKVRVTVQRRSWKSVEVLNDYGDFVSWSEPQLFEGAPMEEDNATFEGVMIRYMGDYRSDTYYENNSADALDTIKFADVVTYNGYAWMRTTRQSGQVNNITPSKENSSYWSDFNGDVNNDIYANFILANASNIAFMQGQNLALTDDNGTITSGMSGGNGVQIFAGAKGVDTETGKPNNPAVAINNNGSGHLAKENIRWSEQGVVDIGDDNSRLTFGANGMEVNATDDTKGWLSYKSNVAPNEFKVSYHKEFTTTTINASLKPEGLTFNREGGTSTDEFTMNINGFSIKKGGNTYNGLTQDVVIGTKTLHIVNGLIVSVT